MMREAGSSKVIPCRVAQGNYKEKIPIKSSLNFTGYYSRCDSSSGCFCLNQPFTVHQLIFFENGKVCEIIGRMHDSINIVTNFNRIVNDEYNLYAWGTYDIYSNKIRATINSLYFSRGQRWKHILTHYEGDIISDNCIANWKAITPYPLFFNKKLNKELNDQFKYDLKDKYFMYHNFEAVSILTKLKN